MSMPAIFFVSDSTTAGQLGLNHSLPSEDVAERSSMDTLKLAILWVILNNSSDDPVDLMDQFEEVRSTESEWTNKIPEDLVSRLASASESELHSAAIKWCDTDEMLGSEIPEVLDLLMDVQRVAKSAHGSRRPLYLYVSL